MNDLHFSIKVNCNAKKFKEYLRFSQKVRDELYLKLSPSIIGVSDFKHLTPTIEPSLLGDKLRENILIDFFNAFDATCVKEASKRLKLCILPNEVVREKLIVRNFLLDL